MNGWVEWLFSRHRAVLSALALLLIAGAWAYLDIAKEAEPDVDIPYVFVHVGLEGVSPEDAERLLIRPMEVELRGIDGLKEMQASASQGGGEIVLEFDAGFDADAVLQDVKDAVDKAEPKLPPNADEPVVQEINTSIFPVLLVTLAGDVPERTLQQLARTTRDEIESVTSVLDVTIAGEREEVVEVIVDPLRIESYGLRADEIIQYLSRSNRLVATGNLDTGDGRFAIKVPGLIETTEDVLDMPVKVEGEAVVRVRDIATVKRTFKDAEGHARVNGLPAVTLEITKRTGENVIDTVAAVRDRVDRLKADWPSNLVVTYSQDQSEFIEMMLTDLENHVVSAVVLVMIVVVGVLGLRSGLLVGVSIPGSFLASILVLHLMGYTVNMVVLFGLILAIGVLVDGAIMVVEYAERHMAAGEDRFRAYALAVRRMGSPIISATLTTLAAFLPMLFWPGIVGEFMRYFPITLVTTLTASLLMALIFVPTLGAHLGKAGAEARWQRRNLQAAEYGNLEEITGAARHYLRGLDKALDYPGRVLGVTLAGLLAAWMLYGIYGKGVEFFPTVEPDFATLLVHARGNLSVDQKDALVREVEQEVLAYRDSFESVYARTAGGGGFSFMGDVAEDVIGRISVEFDDWDKRPPANEILQSIRERTDGLAGLEVEVRKMEAGPPVGKPVQVLLSASDPSRLPAAVETVRQRFQSMQGLTDIEDDRPLPGIEWEMKVDRAQAAKFGVDVTTIGNAAQLVTNGLRLASYRPDDTDEEIDIILRYPERWRTLGQLDQLRVNTPGGAVPISNFIERRAEPKVANLRRVDSARAMAVRANTAPGVLADDKVQELRAWLATDPLPSGVQYEFKGEDEEQRAAEAFLVRALFVALFLMAVILVTQFNSFFSAALVLSAVLVSTIGAVLGLLVTNQAFSIVVTGTGIIALAGVVVNDNIVLIDTHDRLRKRISDPREVILRTGLLRLRPVVLTTITTVLGLMPMMLRMNIDLFNREIAFGAPITQWWLSLATAIVFGLGFATVLTLIITPCALMARVKVRERLHGKSANAGHGDSP
ncbi:multidrug efflux pump [Halospina denitrificans]|uniref:Multidrug efflux pump n=1 Tax=Halospina denitrificans TaxID=332522 RepID=A0A4R7JVB1_9GAMM|nr:efflux RND transporter permease subunit [Halospina denitrificans]TDT41353.1 multidrug efflux pump [Halospina denitrificans]